MKKLVAGDSENRRNVQGKCGKSAGEVEERWKWVYNCTCMNKWGFLLVERVGVEREV